LIVIAAVTSLFGLGFATLLPAWAVEVLHGGPDTNGFLQSARGIGSLAGALMIASLGRFRFKGKLLTHSLVFPIPVLIFAMAAGYRRAAGACRVGQFMVMLNMANALVQTSCRRAAWTGDGGSFVSFGHDAVGALTARG
jgi:hypothetical protein